MPRVSEEMKQWSAMLEAELETWPKVTSRPMFGMRGFYHRKKIFAALPVTRGFGTPNQLIFRIKPMPPELLQRAQSESRMDLETRTPGAKWFTFQLNATEDLRDALWWLNQAYERAK
jgi:TfoX N-terminal domain